MSDLEMVQATMTDAAAATTVTAAEIEAIAAVLEVEEQKPFVCHHPGCALTPLAEKEAWVPELKAISRNTGRAVKPEELKDHTICGAHAGRGRKAGFKFYRYAVSHQMLVANRERRREERAYFDRYAAKQPDDRRHRQAAERRESARAKGRRRVVSVH